MDVKAEFNRERLLALARNEGLRTSGSNRMECPWRCSPSKAEAARSAKVDDSASGALWKCHACGKSGSVVDLVMATRSLGDVGAAFKLLEELFPHLKDVQQKPAGPKRDARKLYEGFSVTDPMATAYLKTRKLEAAIDLGLVRFNVGRSTDAWLNGRARDGYRVAMPLRDSFGNVITFQLRAANDKLSPAKISCAGIEDYGAVAFGDPPAAAESPVVYLSEGMADTLAITIGVGKNAQVLGAPGADQIVGLFDLVGDPEGRTFVLCPQNDVNPKVRLPSQLAFRQLGKKLSEAGADVRTLHTPEGTKDPALWLQTAGRDRFRAAVGKPPDKAGPTAGSAALQLKPAQGPNKLTTSFASICAILENPKTRELVLGPGKLGFDEKAMLPTLDQRVLEEVDVARLRQRCELTFTTSRKKGLEFKQTDIEQALLMVAKAHRFSPVADYLNGMKWDGVERIASLHEDIFGLLRPQALVPLLLRRWFISAVARALRPGCKVDTALVLVGDQGLLKSTFFSSLVPDASWFSDSAMDIGNKDGFLLLARIWILEWAELESMQRAREQNVKQFISSPSDSFRAPYARRIAEHPRSCVIVGSTNEREFLTDPTGNRRYWPIEVHQRIDIKLLRGQRDQLWAEAVHAFKAQERWWLNTEEEVQLREITRRYETRDAWETAVLAFAARLLRDDGFETADVLLEAIKKHPGQWTKADEMRVSGILRKAGYQKVHRQLEGHRTYRWFPPGKEIQEDLPL